MGYFDENLENLKKFSDGVEPELEVSTRLLEVMRTDLVEMNDEFGDDPNIHDLWESNRFAITRLLGAFVDLERRYLHDRPSIES